MHRPGAGLRIGNGDCHGSRDRAITRACTGSAPLLEGEGVAAVVVAEALVLWLRDRVAFTHKYRGAVALMAAVMDDPESALHASCVTVRAAGTQLLTRAQAAGAARTDLDGTDLFALVAALARLGDQPSLEPRSAHLFDVVASAILTGTGSADTEGELHPPARR